MNAPIVLTHTHGERLTVHAAGTELLTYVYAPDPVAFESRKPYLHPLRTLAGRPATGYRPSDHRWHKGLQMTASHLSGQNFWGGNSYVPAEGYRELPERIGSMRHDGFASLTASEARAEFTELLTWLTHAGEEWAREQRTVTVHSVDTEAGCYALDWSIELTNTRGAPLEFGSPTTFGRAMAGYTGLHWRGPRDFTGGRLLDFLGPVTQEEAMGRAAAGHPWLAFVAERDGVDACSTLVFAHAPENAAGIHPSHWFVRSTPEPTVAFSWAFFEEFALDVGASFAFRYRVLVVDGDWDAGQIERHLSGVPW